MYHPITSLKPKTQSRHPWQNRIKTKYLSTYKYGHNSAKNPVYPSSKQLSDKRPGVSPIKFTVIGNRLSKEFIYCSYLVKGLHKYRSQEFEAPNIRGVTGIEWPIVWHDLKIQYGDSAYCLISQVAVLIGDSFLGGEAELREFVETKYVYHLYLDYYKEGIQQFVHFTQSSGRSCAYLQISINNAPIGTLIFMLYDDVAPLTCQNFLQMCEATKGGYEGSPVHRIVKDCWIQCGGFNLKNSNNLAFENCIILPDRRGVLCMANDGRNVECSTQFFVLLQPAPWMQQKYVAFGQLIEGEQTLAKIENVPTWYESPTYEIIIYKAGILNLDCQRIPVNKNTRALIEAHIEDLVILGQMFFEEILDKTFIQIELRRLNRLEMCEAESTDTDEEEKNDRQPESIMYKNEDKDKKNLKFTQNSHPASSSNVRTTGNNDFDVEVYEYEDYSYKPDSMANAYAIAPNDHDVTEKLYYIPLADVPYPGEVDSTFDLKKLLRGDYCLESDLERRSDKEKVEAVKKLSMPLNLVQTLFDFFVETKEPSELSFDAEGADAVQEYLIENTDKASFAGRVVRKIANLNGKLKLFKNTETEEQLPQQILTDEDLRLIRTANKELQDIQHKKVSIIVLPDKSPSNKIRRRPTGYIKVDNVSDLIVKSFTSLMDEETEEVVRKVHIASDAIDTQRPEVGPSRLGAEIGSQRQSVLTRLYDNLLDSCNDEAPTLKDYKPHTTVKYKSPVLLTNSPTFNFKSINDLREKYHRYEDHSIERVLLLQHGQRVSRKISSDYCKTIGLFEHKIENSIRSIEYSKKRPAMTIAEYQKKTQRYRKQLKDTTEDTSGILTETTFYSSNVRLTGDSSHYASSTGRSNE